MNLRDALRRISSELGERGNYTSNEVIAELKVRHPTLVSQSAASLQDMALKKMLSDVESRAVKNPTLSQRDLFLDEIRLPRSFNCKRIGGERGQRKSTNKITIADARLICQPKLINAEKHSPTQELQKFLLEFSEYLHDENELLVDMLKRVKELITQKSS